MYKRQSLEEIARLLPSGDGAWQHGELLEGLRRKVAEIEALQRRLEQNKAQLLVAIESIENKPDGLQCTENTQRVLERLREEGPPQTVGRPRQTRSRGSSPTPVSYTHLGRSDAPLRCRRLSAGPQVKAAPFLASGNAG